MFQDKDSRNELLKLLVNNYLQHVDNIDNTILYTYEEFNTDKIKQRMIKKTNDVKHIIVFNFNENEYNNTQYRNIFKFNNIMYYLQNDDTVSNDITFIIIPPIGYNDYNYLNEYIYLFNKYKDIIVNKLDYTQHNHLCKLLYDDRYEQQYINNILCRNINIVLSNENNHEDDDYILNYIYDTIGKNICKFTIRVLNKEQLLSIPLHNEQLCEILIYPYTKSLQNEYKQIDRLNELLNRNNKQVSQTSKDKQSTEQDNNWYEDEQNKYLSCLVDFDDK